MHLVLGQALERYGTASGASAGAPEGRAGAGGLQALTTSWVHLPPLPRPSYPPHSSAGQAWGWEWGAEQELDWVFQL